MQILLSPPSSASLLAWLLEAAVLLLAKVLALALSLALVRVLALQLTVPVVVAAAAVVAIPVDDIVPAGFVSSSNPHVSFVSQVLHP